MIPHIMRGGRLATAGWVWTAFRTAAVTDSVKSLIGMTFGDSGDVLIIIA
jgi:hypothetical protein